METIFSFLVNASGGIILFYVVYWLFLRKETFYKANRWFLLLALATAVLLPVFPIHYSVLVEQTNATVTKTISDTFKNNPVITGTTAETTTNMSWQQAVLLVYITGASIFLLRLLSQTFVLVFLMIKYRIKSLDGVRIVENEKYGLPFSFFNVVFINPKFHTQDDLPEILAHEKVHIREFHWFDLLFIELLTVIFWFNPFIWFFERSIKQNHEYLADKGVLAQGHAVARYQAILLNQLMGMQIIGVTNNLNFALNTNRLKMMTKKKTSRVLGVKFVWALPALALLLFAFAEPNYRVKDVEPRGEEVAIEKDTSQETLTITGKVVMMETGEPLPGASIVVKGTTLGTVADIGGNFKLVVPDPNVEKNQGLNTTIVVSFVGLGTVETQVGASKKQLEKTKGVISAKIKMEEEVIEIGNDTYIGAVPPPPPPKVKPAVEKEVKSPPPPPLKKGEKEQEVFYVVEDMPKYPGGHAALQNYVEKMQQKLAQDKGIKGKAKVAFTINNKGKVTGIEIVEKDNDGAAKGAVVIADGMETWSPGKQRGKPVSVKYMLPVEFK